MRTQGRCPDCGAVVLIERTPGTPATIPRTSAPAAPVSMSGAESAGSWTRWSSSALGLGTARSTGY
jgi:hypothetical protein